MRSATFYVGSGLLCIFFLCLSSLKLMLVFGATTITLWSLGFPLKLSSCLTGSSVVGGWNMVAMSVITNSSVVKISGYEKNVVGIHVGIEQKTLFIFYGL